MNYKNIIAYILIGCTAIAQSATKSTAKSLSTELVQAKMEQTLPLPAELLTLILSYASLPDGLASSTRYTQTPFKLIAAESIPTTLPPSFSHDHAYMLMIQLYLGKHILSVTDRTTGTDFYAKKLLFPSTPLCCSWSCHNRFIACAEDMRNEIRELAIIDPVNKKIFPRIKHIWHCAWSPSDDATFAVTRSGELLPHQSIDIYTLLDGTLNILRTLKIREIATHPPSYIFWPPHHQLIIVLQAITENSDYYRCYAYDITTGKKIYTINVLLSEETVSVSFPQDGSLMAIVTNTGVEFYTTATGLPQGFVSISDAHHAVWINNKELCVSTCSDNPCITIIDVDTKKIVETLAMPLTELPGKKQLILNYDTKHGNLLIAPCSFPASEIMEENSGSIIFTLQRTITRAMLQKLFTKSTHEVA
jgi:WD40 repeat protein